MIKTKHDLSALTATLNLEELIEATAQGLGFARAGLERALGELQQYHSRGEHLTSIFTAQNIVEAANSVLKLQTNYHYLLEARDKDREITVEKS